MTDSNDMREAYNLLAWEYESWYARSGQFSQGFAIGERAAWFAQLAELGREAARFGAQLATDHRARVLDLACGTGKWFNYFLQSLPRQGKLVGLDLSPAALKQAQEVLHDTPDEARAYLVQADARQLPFADGAFNLVFAGFWLSHLPPEQLRSFATEIKRIMKPGGNMLAFELKPEQKGLHPLGSGVPLYFHTPEVIEQAFGAIFYETSVRTTRDFFIVAQANL